MWLNARIYLINQGIIIINFKYPYRVGMHKRAAHQQRVFKIICFFFVWIDIQSTHVGTHLALYIRQNSLEESIHVTKRQINDAERDIWYCPTLSTYYTLSPIVAQIR